MLTTGGDPLVLTRNRTPSLFVVVEKEGLGSGRGVFAIIRTAACGLESVVNRAVCSIVLINSVPPLDVSVELSVVNLCTSLLSNIESCWSILTLVTRPLLSTNVQAFLMQSRSHSQHRGVVLLWYLTTVWL